MSAEADNKNLRKILHRANTAYPDGMIETYFDMKTGEERGEDIAEFGGDTLALFIGREIVDVYNPETSFIDNVANAIRALEVARAQIEEVIYGLASRSVPGHKKK